MNCKTRGVYAPRTNGQPFVFLPHIISRAGKSRALPVLFLGAPQLPRLLRVPEHLIPPVAPPLIPLGMADDQPGTGHDPGPGPDTGTSVTAGQKHLSAGASGAHVELRHNQSSV